MNLADLGGGRAWGSEIAGSLCRCTWSSPWSPEPSRSLPWCKRPCRCCYCIRWCCLYSWVLCFMFREVNRGHFWHDHFDFQFLWDAPCRERGSSALVIGLSGGSFEATTCLQNLCFRKPQTSLSSWLQPFYYSTFCPSKALCPSCRPKRCPSYPCCRFQCLKTLPVK